MWKLELINQKIYIKSDWNHVNLSITYLNYFSLYLETSTKYEYFAHKITLRLL